jgi:RimJ/RimL family protein N-acetyltransferase
VEPIAEPTWTSGLGPALPAEVLAASGRLPDRPDGAVLEGATVRLRPFKGDDVDELFLISSGAPVTRLGRDVDTYDPDERIWRYMPIGPFADAAELAAFLGPFSSQPDARTFVVQDRASGELLGSASLLANSPADLKVEIGALWCTPAVQGRGINLEACRLLLDHLFGLGYLRVEWKCHAGNDRSRAAAARLGFRFEASRSST